MKSSDVYKKLATPLTPLMKKMGFKKISGSRPRWFKSFEDKDMHIYLKTGKYPWEPYSGCKVAIQAYVCSKGLPNSEVECDIHHCRRFFEPGSQNIEYILKRNSVVVDKIKNINLASVIEDPDNWYDDIDELKDLHDSELMFIDSHTDKERVEMMIDTELLYLDSDDIDYWSKFIAGIMVENVERLMSSNAIA